MMAVRPARPGSSRRSCTIASASARSCATMPRSGGHLWWSRGGGSIIQVTARTGVPNGACRWGL
eukprot:8324281-Lingulodinium_polyedra.AAC.1